MYLCFFFYLFVWACCGFFFLFQAEDGIRDSSVTGVQTCALPISAGWAWAGSPGRTEKTSARTPTTQNRREQASRKPSFSADDGCGQDSVPATEDGRTTFPCWTRLAPEPDCDAAVAGHPHEVGLDERPYCA